VEEEEEEDVQVLVEQAQMVEMAEQPVQRQRPEIQIQETAAVERVVQR
jgi:hypothetical protein